MASARYPSSFSSNSHSGPSGSRSVRSSSIGSMNRAFTLRSGMRTSVEQRRFLSFGPADLLGRILRRPPRLHRLRQPLPASRSEAISLLSSGRRLKTFLRGRPASLGRCDNCCPPFRRQDPLYSGILPWRPASLLRCWCAGAAYFAERLKRPLNRCPLLLQARKNTFDVAQIISSLCFAIRS